MKATIDIPDALYRQIKARTALGGRTVRDVTIEAYQRWLAETPAPYASTAEDQPSAGEAWLAAWEALVGEVEGSGHVEPTAAAEPTTAGRPMTREILQADRR